MGEKTITSITARKGIRGNVGKFSFSGVEAQEHIDEYMEEVRMTKSDLDTYESNASGSATAAEESAKAAALSAKAAAVSQGTAADSAKSAAESEVNASESASAAKASAEAAGNAVAEAESIPKEAESWAVGGTGTREGEDADNAKYYASQAETSSSAAKSDADRASRYVNSNYAIEAKSYAVGGTGTRDGEDTDNAKYYYSKIAGTEVGDLAELEKMIEQNLNAVNHEQNVYPAFFADRLANVTDLNTCITNGMYQFTASASHAPVAAIGLVAVFNSVASGETGYIAQYAWAASDAHTVYARDDHGGTWGSWQQIGADGDALTDITKRMATAEGEIDTLQKNTETIQEDLTTLIGSDDGKSVRTIASEELVTELIPDNAKASLDTIQEIAAWIQSHPDDASAMNEAIAALSAAQKSTIRSLSVSGRTITMTFVDGSTKTITTQDTTYSDATTSASGLMSASDKSKLNGIAAGANAYTLPNATSAVLGGVKVGSNITVSSGTISVSKANVTNALGFTPANATALTTLQTEVNARPSTRKLATQTLTASGGTRTWTDSCITDDSLIDVYASIPNIAPSAIEQSGTTVTVTFDAQDSDFKVAIVVM